MACRGCRDEPASAADRRRFPPSGAQVAVRPSRPSSGLAAPEGQLQGTCRWRIARLALSQAECERRGVAGRSPGLGGGSGRRGPGRPAGRRRGCRAARRRATPYWPAGRPRDNFPFFPPCIGKRRGAKGLARAAACGTMTASLCRWQPGSRAAGTGGTAGPRRPRTAGRGRARPRPPPSASHLACDSARRAIRHRHVPEASLGRASPDDGRDGPHRDLAPEAVNLRRRQPKAGSSRQPRQAMAFLLGHRASSRAAPLHQP